MRVLRSTACFLVALLAVGFRWPWDLNRVDQQAAQAYGRGEYQSAIDLYGEVLADRPATPEVLYNLGTSHLALGGHGEALERLGQALDQQPPSELAARIRYNQGMALAQLNEYQKAIEAFERVLEIDPADADARHNIEVLRRLMEQQQQAQSPDQQQDEDDDQNAGADQDQESSQDNQNQEQSQPQSGPERQSTNPAPRPMSEDEVNRRLRALQQDEQNLRRDLGPAAPPRVRPGEEQKADMGVGPVIGGRNW